MNYDHSKQRTNENVCYLLGKQRPFCGRQKTKPNFFFFRD